MKHTFAIFLLLVLVACGKSSSKRSSADFQQQSDYVEVSADSGPSDLLNVTLSSAAHLTTDQIFFAATRSQSDKGLTHTCTLTINQVQPWSYALTAEGLSITLPDGSTYLMRPAVSSNQGINGSWIWKGRENNMRVIRRFSFIPNQVILNLDCES
jgi:hypothetical protein